MKSTITQVRCPNPKCGHMLVNSQETFCPECGTRLPATADGAGQVFVPSAANPIAPSGLTLELAGRGSRIGAFLIDVVLAGVLTPLLLAPVVGQYLLGIIWGLYFLFRDINGASLGKMILGIKVISKNGRSASTRQKLVRNLLLVLPDLAEFLPFLGVFLAPGAFLAIIGLESLILLATGERLGDKIAGTMVVKKNA